MVVYLDMDNPRIAEVRNAHPFHDWLHVFARPKVYHGLSRKPPREHILRLLDAYLPYASSRRAEADQQGYYCFEADEERREELTYRLRALLEQWAPHDLPTELTETARALLEAEGVDQPIGDWDDFEGDQETPLEEALVWPESMADIDQDNIERDKKAEG